MDKWKPVTFAELAASVEGNVPYDLNTETYRGGLSTAAFSSGMKKAAKQIAKYSRALAKMKKRDGSTACATSQGK